MEKELIELFEKADGDKNKQLSKGKLKWPVSIEKQSKVRNKTF